jgi:hypothetical protein
MLSDKFFDQTMDLESDLESDLYYENDFESYYDSCHNIFKSIPPNNSTFINKTYQEILEIDDLITIVLSNVKNPPSFILTDLSFIKYGFHKRLMKYTPKNCSCITTKMIIIAEKELFDMYKNLLKKPKKLYQINNVLAQKDYFMSPPSITDLINIKKILFNKVFDKSGDELMFKSYGNGWNRLNKRKFNFDTIRECIDSDHYIMERLETIQGDYNRVETGITDNTTFVDGRNHFYYLEYNKIDREQNEDISDFIARVDMIKRNKYIKKKQEYLEIKTLLVNLKRLILYNKFEDEKLNSKIVQTFINCIVDRLFKSHRHYSFALRDLKEYQLISVVDSSAIWCAIYAYYVEECNSSVKVSKHTFKNYTEPSAHYIFTEKDIPLLNEINNMKTVNTTRYSHLSKKDIFIPIMRKNCESFSTLPEKFGGSRQNRRINTLEQFRNYFNIFTRGMFKDFDWIGGAVMVSGSCITACLAHFEGCGNTSNQFKQFLKDNYENSDIDICTSDNYLLKLQRNLFELFYNKESKSTVSFYSSFDKEHFINTENLVIVDYTKSCNEDEEDKPVYACCYCHCKQNDIYKNETHLITCQIAKNYMIKGNRRDSRIYKLSIDPPKGDNHFRSIDVYSNTLGKIGLYHMPCVRAAYTGHNLYMYPSFVCATLSGYCADYKWFKGKKNPLKIILDKWMKGFNIILTRQEQIQLMSYFIYNFSEKAKTTPCMKRYLNNWNAFNYENTIRDLTKTIKLTLHNIDTATTDEEVKRMILNLITDI